MHHNQRKLCFVGHDIIVYEMSTKFKLKGFKWEVAHLTTKGNKVLDLHDFSLLIKTLLQTVHFLYVQRAGFVPIQQICMHHSTVC